MFINLRLVFLPRYLCKANLGAVCVTLRKLNPLSPSTDDLTPEVGCRGFFLPILLNKGKP